MKIEELTAIIAAACPIDGINSSGAIWFKAGATPEQQAAAQALMAQHLPSLSDSGGVPQAVTMRQARLALLQIGKLVDVTTAINSLPSPQKEAAQIEWEYSNEVQRGNAFVTALGGALGLTSQQLDELFTLAATL